MGEGEPFVLPPCAEQFIAAVVKKMRYRKRVRKEVQAELAAHFEDELRDCAGAPEREERAKRLIEEFGDAKLLAVLCRRAKKRCRPLWKKVLVRCVQASAVFVLYVAACMMPLYLGRLTIKMDYVSWLNETVRGGREEVDNARPYYEKAVKLFVDMPEWMIEGRFKWPGDMNDVGRQSLSDWLNQNTAALDAVRAGSRQPYCWTEYRSVPIVLPEGVAVTSQMVFAGILGDCMSPLATYRQLAFALQWQVRYAAFSDDLDAAFSDCLVLAKFGDHFLGHGLSIEQLVGMGIERIANDSLLSLLRGPGVGASRLANVQGLWQKRLDRPGAGISFDAEQGVWLDRIQRSFTDDGKGDGRALARGAAYWMRGYRDYWRALTLRYPTRREAVAEIDAYYSHLRELQAKFPWEWDRQDIDVNDPTPPMMESLCLVMQWPRKYSLASLFLRMQNPPDLMLVQMSWRRRTEGAAVLTILAVERYRMDQGQYPEDLKQVVDGGYLLQVPRDPFGPGSLSYRRTDGGFILYSRGKDRKDDGGRRAEHDDTGDRVFWPVPAR